MCGIFGFFGSDKVERSELDTIISYAQRRGRDSSGFIYDKEDVYCVNKADINIKKLQRKINFNSSKVVLGHSRLITNGLLDNQPIIVGDVAVFHNGIIVNEEEIWSLINKKPKLEIDTEIIGVIFQEGLDKGKDLKEVANYVLEICKGVVACCVIAPKIGKLVIFSNNGSLYHGIKNDGHAFSSEEYPLQIIGYHAIRQIKDPEVFSIPTCTKIEVETDSTRNTNLLPKLFTSLVEEKLLVTDKHNLLRCTKCILPSTMPFISFDREGVCNYCKNYKIKNRTKPKEDLLNLIAPYRKVNGADCILPFSGGRDSCYALHLAVKEMNLKPITYTYDWGMVTDLGRRNISRMSSALGVENIIIAADIEKKRKNIEMNLRAWLKSPNLGMISILTAGDKHFFKYLKIIQDQTSIKLNLWGINPLEVTHFKSGFLGVKPDFEEQSVYANGIMKQLRYQYLRFKAMTKSPSYFNSSIYDTLSGEYYRSFSEKEDYYHIFDYWTWDEKIINETLKIYDWELATDTSTTWRIGDGTAGFYNYIYYTVAGFTEHDTFRSNQIREGAITRNEALRLVEEENQPRYANIKWYLDALHMNFEEVITAVNNIPRLVSN